MVQIFRIGFIVFLLSGFVSCKSRKADLYTGGESDFTSRASMPGLYVDTIVQKCISDTMNNVLVHIFSCMPTPVRNGISASSQSDMAFVLTPKQHVSKSKPLLRFKQEEGVFWKIVLSVFLVLLYLGLLWTGLVLAVYYLSWEIGLFLTILLTSPYFFFLSKTGLKLFKCIW